VNLLKNLNDNNSNRVFTDARAKLRSWLTDWTVKSRVEYHGKLRMHTPCVNGMYKGIWPDDFLWPLMADPSLMDQDTLQGAIDFVSASVLGLPCLPDRIEPDGMPVMQPGWLDNPHAHLMPLHLPAAWMRLLDYAASSGVGVPRKRDWARLFQRSLDAVPFACGLAYIDPQRPCVGFGFHDPCAITGFELASSLALYRGLQRAAAFFSDVVAPDQKECWLAQAAGIQRNLDRLWSEEDGAYFAGSKDCRQIDVWLNGLAYWLATEAKQVRIVAWFKANQERVFLEGHTRQIAEADGWQRQLVDTPPGTYTNGGFWSTGSGFVLPAIADQDPEFAATLTRQLIAKMEATDFAEWISAEGQGGGAKGFLAGIAMPAIGLQSILEQRPLIHYF
jgi:hypothetical protein